MTLRTIWIMDIIRWPGNTAMCYRSWFVGAGNPLLDLAWTQNGLGWKLAAGSDGNSGIIWWGGKLVETEKFFASLSLGGISIVKYFDIDSWFLQIGK